MDWNQLAGELLADARERARQAGIDMDEIADELRDYAALQAEALAAIVEADEPGLQDAVDAASHNLALKAAILAARGLEEQEGRLRGFLAGVLVTLARVMVAAPR